MTACTLCATVFGAFVAVSTFLSANAQAVRALTDGNDLIVTGGKAETVEYEGRKSVRLTTQSKEDVFAFLKGIQFQDGTIEADIAMKVTTPPGVRMPGFLGIAFRARADGSHYDLFYLRPGNSHAEDQAMRNHSVQYVAAPGFDWYKLRREWPWIYESYADLQPEGWNRVYQRIGESELDRERLERRGPGGQCCLMGLSRGGSLFLQRESDSRQSGSRHRWRRSLRSMGGKIRQRLR